jgi:hypothetical protein
VDLDSDTRTQEKKMDHPQNNNSNHININLFATYDFPFRLTNMCHEKCIRTEYREEHLTKGESVCVDRCVAKFFDVSLKVGKKLDSYGKQQQKLAEST